MSHAYEIPIELVGRRRIDATVHGHLIRTDQPIERGGDGRAPAPFDLFLASIGTCAGITIQAFCAKRDLPFEDIALVERVALDDHGVLTSVDIEIRLPASFPARYVGALEKAVATCPVARSLLAKPTFAVITHAARMAAGADIVA